MNCRCDEFFSLTILIKIRVITSRLTVVRTYIWLNAAFKSTDVRRDQPNATKCHSSRNLPYTTPQCTPNRGVGHPHRITNNTDNAPLISETEHYILLCSALL